MQNELNFHVFCIEFFYHKLKFEIYFNNIHDLKYESTFALASIFNHDFSIIS